MTQQEIYREAAALPLNKQKELVEKLSRNLQRETGENGNEKTEEKELSIEERKAIVDSLRGVLKMKKSADDERRSQRNLLRAFSGKI